MHDKDKAKIVDLKKQLSAKTSPPKSLVHTIFVEGLFCLQQRLETILERDAKLPMKVTRRVALHHNTRYDVGILVVFM